LYNEEESSLDNEEDQISMDSEELISLDNAEESAEESFSDSEEESSLSSDDEMFVDDEKERSSDSEDEIELESEEENGLYIDDISLDTQCYVELLETKLRDSRVRSFLKKAGCHGLGHVPVLLSRLGAGNVFLLLHDNPTLWSFPIHGTVSVDEYRSGRYSFLWRHAVASKSHWLLSQAWRYDASLLSDGIVFVMILF